MDIKKQIMSLLKEKDLTLDDFIDEQDLYFYLETTFHYEFLDGANNKEELEQGKEELFKICEKMY